MPRNSIYAMSDERMILCFLILNHVMEALSSREHCANAEKVANDDHSETNRRHGLNLELEGRGDKILLDKVLTEGEAVRYNIRRALIDKEAVPFEVFRVVTAHEQVLEEVRDRNRLGIEE